MSKLYVVRWTWDQHKVYKLKKDALAHCKAWKEFKESQGWRTRAAKSKDGGFAALSPDYDPETMGHEYYRRHGTPDTFLHVCLIEVYDAETKARIWPKLPDPADPNAEPKPKPERKPRRGKARKPIGA